MVSVSMQRERAVPRTDTEAAGTKAGQKTADRHVLKKVFICSPFRPVGETAGQRDNDWKKNIALAKQACRYAVDEGYVPYAPHLYFPQFLSEGEADEREIGIIMGLSWLARCDEVWVAGMRISEGMSREILQAKEWGIPLKAYVPIPGKRNRVFEAHFLTEEEFYKTLSDEI